MDENLIQTFIKDHSGELLIVILALLIVVSLIVIVPQLLRANMRKLEMQHEQRLRALERGTPLPAEDEKARFAGRTALLVPMVVMIAVATVTCFLVVYKSENLFAVTLGIWVVAGVVSLAAITGGVALIGRLAQFESGKPDAAEEDEPADQYVD